MGLIMISGTDRICFPIVELDTLHVAWIHRGIFFCLHFSRVFSFGPKKSFSLVCASHADDLISKYDWVAFNYSANCWGVNENRVVSRVTFHRHEEFRLAFCFTKSSLFCLPWHLRSCVNFSAFEVQCTNTLSVKTRWHLTKSSIRKSVSFGHVKI